MPLCFYHSLALVSGFYNDIAFDSFSRENPNIAFVHAAPGLVASNWGTELNFFMRGIARAALHVRQCQNDLNHSNQSKGE